MDHIFIINPSAGKGKQAETIAPMAQALAQRHGLSVACHRTTSAQHTTELVRQIASLGRPVRFYACGGDGTLHYVVQGAVGFENAEVTCIPAGTGNDFLRNFGADSAKFADPENLWDGDSMELDLIECNGRYGLSIACFGVDARIGRDVHQFSKYPFMSGIGGYVMSALYHGVRPIGRQWQLVVDGVITQGAFAVVSVCNGRYYGGGFNPMPMAQLDDGKLNAIVVEGIGTYRFLRLFPKYKEGRLEDIADYVTLYQPRVLELRSQQPNVTVCLDGESVESTMAVVRLAKEKLRFFAPKGANPNATVAVTQDAKAYS
ncbi:diacylglycerol kinase family protein [Bengtsoniella intestinalis]|uniref:diacylglycerol/lipid kinase family protein n=1 Tax=Bengtsoniella intestinalis TaxID=3073143 RepID=UPI00391F04C1